MSGSQVPWSGAGVLGTAAGVAVTREVIQTLAPVLQGREQNTLGAAQNELAQLQVTLDAVRERNGDWPTLSQLNRVQRERIDGRLAGTLAALSAVPGTLRDARRPPLPQLSKP